MNSLEGALEGTEPFGREQLRFSYSFTDHYAKQWMSTLKWFERQLKANAKLRDSKRRSDPITCAAQRKRLAEWSGFAFAYNDQTEATYTRLDEQAIAYRITTGNELTYTGICRLPSVVRAIVLVPGKPDAHGWLRLEAMRTEGYLIVLPDLVHSSFSLRDDPDMFAYAFADDCLLHLHAFIIGGSLPGLEAAELATVARQIQRDFCVAHLKEAPVVLDLRHGKELAGLVAAALQPGLASALMLGNALEQLDHQEEAGLPDTIWRFHEAFDALELLQLSGASEISFPWAEGVPGAIMTRVHWWFSSQQSLQSVTLVMRDEGEQTFPLLTMQDEGFELPESVCQQASNEERASSEADTVKRKLTWLRGQIERVNLERMAQVRMTQGHMGSRNRSQATETDAVHEQLLQRLAQCVGHLPIERGGNRPKTMLISDNEKPYKPYKQYAVLLETLPGVVTAGYLLLPKTQQPAPAVICQHGLMARPDDLVYDNGEWYYYQLANVLAGKGYAVYAPFMNWGWGGNPARDCLAKHAYALGYAAHIPEAVQVQTIVDFLQSRPEIDGNRIGFYGLSYGGYASLWLTAYETRLRAVVTAGHFNLWLNKLVSLTPTPPYNKPNSYISVEESMDMFHYNVARHLSHAQLACADPQRAYLVENGLLDPVTPREWVESEYKQVASWYAHYSSPDKTELSHFEGPHRIWGERSLQFLWQWLVTEGGKTNG